MSIDNKLIEYSKGLRLKVIKQQDVEDTILGFIRERRLILYGGMAMDRLLAYKTGGRVRIYDENAEPDYDVYSKDFLGDAKELLERIKALGYRYTRITPGIVPGTARIFVDFQKNSCIDITHLGADEYEEYRYLEVDGLNYVDPQVIKIDLYRNLCINLERDMHRFDKAYARVMLLEEYFPPETNRATGMTIPTEIPEGLMGLFDRSRDIINGAPALAYWLGTKSTPAMFRHFPWAIYCPDVASKIDLLGKGVLGLGKDLVVREDSEGRVVVSARDMELLEFIPMDRCSYTCVQLKDGTRVASSNFLKHYLYRTGLMELHIAKGLPMHFDPLEQYYFDPDSVEIPKNEELKFTTIM